MVFLQNRILEYRDKISEEERQTGLKQQVEKFRQAMKYPNTHANKVRIASVVGEIQYLYGSFNNELFESELNDLLSEEIEKVGDLDKEFSRVNGHIGQWRRKMKALWDNVSDVFKDGQLPNFFRMRTHTPHCSKLEIAECLIRTFAKDWRIRACKFDRPVSIYGTDISSMPEAKQKVWMEAYKKMGLNDKNKYPKRAVYAAQQSKDKEVMYLSGEQLPGKFGVSMKGENE